MIEEIKNKQMDIPSSLAIIAFCGLIHASFQLSVSVLTLLSGHILSTSKTQARILRLSTGFLIGAGVMTSLLLSSTFLALLQLFGTETPQIVWATGCGLLVGVAISIWLFYFRHEKGTTLWIPRNIATYLTDRIHSTKRGAEAFGLGLSSVIGEILFIIAPLFIAALTLVQLPPMWRLAGIGIYTVISLLSLIIVWVLVGSGHSISQIQKWRESNKNFLQFVAGAGLIVLVFFIFVNEILCNTAGTI